MTSRRPTRAGTSSYDPLRPVRCHPRVDPRRRARPRPADRGARTATVEFLDVGQGDAILIRSPEGKTALIDAGPSHHVVPLLRERGVTAIDLLLISHHHAAHYGGADAMVREFNPRVFLATGSSHTTEHYLNLLRLVRDRGIRAVQPTDAPRTIELGSVVLTVLPQPPGSGVGAESVGDRDQV